MIIYPNRLADKIKLEAQFGKMEGGRRKFYYKGTQIAYNYIRVVYGDHGPYIEFQKNDFSIRLVDKFGREPTMPKLEDAKFYYFWLHPIGHDLKVYWQIKPVTNLPNAPARKDGLPSKFNRPEGYADYRRGLYYIDPYDLEIK